MPVRLHVTRPYVIEPGRVLGLRGLAVVLATVPALGQPERLSLENLHGMFIEALSALRAFGFLPRHRPQRHHG
jgi:hypothetical protein